MLVVVRVLNVLSMYEELRLRGLLLCESCTAALHLAMVWLIGDQFVLSLCFLTGMFCQVKQHCAFAGCAMHVGRRLIRFACIAV